MTELNDAMVEAAVPHIKDLLRMAGRDGVLIAAQNVTAFTSRALIAALAIQPEAEQGWQPRTLPERPTIKPGWRDDGLEEAIEIVSAIPELNAVLERESALLAQNVVSAMLSAAHENQAATLANNETKKVLARSMLVGLQANISSALDAKSALLAEAATVLEEAARNLHNDFEPDNQSLAYKRARAVLAKLKAANAHPAPQPEGHGAG